MFSFATLHIFASRRAESLHKSILQVDCTTDDLQVAVSRKESLQTCFKVLTVLLPKIRVFCDMTPSWLVHI